MEPNKIYAHLNDNGDLEELKTHLDEVANLCANFAKCFDSKELGFLIGSLHDLGKCTIGFQKRLLCNGPKVDHSTHGAKQLMGTFLIGSYCIAGHHSGIPDGGSDSDCIGHSTLQSRLKKPLEKLINNEFISTLKGFPKTIPTLTEILNSGCMASMYTRMLYSCLVDADFLATESFMMPNNKRLIYCNYSFNPLLGLLNKHLNKYKKSTKPINVIRNTILNECINKSKNTRGVYVLSAPTGTGKTLSSFSFALNHLIKNNMKRIIYVIPYTSIIEQNAEVFRSIFGDVVLEHHSNVDFEDDELEASSLKLATENWDMPIIVTTNVQFFNSLYSNKSSKTRKLHNIANSVVIFDEVQMLPTDYLKPCLYAVSELVNNYKCSTMLCSATQPPLSKFLKNMKIISKLLIDDNLCDFEDLIRVTYKYIGEVSDIDLASELKNKHQVLCIVNSKFHALKLFQLVDISNSENIFFLTTDLCPIHRSEVIFKITNCLKNNEKCLVISTSLIEAGVDLSFSSVYRATAGADNIIQAAGRCNREGSRTKEESIVTIFDPEEKYNKRTPKSLLQVSEITKLVLKEKGFNFNDASLIDSYYRYLYKATGENNFDVKGILEMQSCNVQNIPFKKIAKSFSLIDDDQYTIFIPFDDVSIKIISELKSGYVSTKKIRKLNQYCVNVRKWKLEKLLESHIVKNYDGIFILDNVSKYDKKFGLSNSSDVTCESFFY